MIQLEAPTLRGVLDLAEQMPAEERRVFEALYGERFNAEQFAARAFLQPGYHFMGLRYGGDPVWAGGFGPTHTPGVYRTWFCAPEWAWKAHGEAITKDCRAIIQRVLTDKLAHRIETVTLASQTRSRAWYEKIGLTYESTLRGYSSKGDDLVLYVALRDSEAG